MNKSRIALALISLIFSASVSVAMDVGVENHLTINDLYFSGYLDDWEFDFAKGESACMLSAIKTKMGGNINLAQEQFFSCARRGSVGALVQLGLLAKSSKPKIAADWYRLAYLLQFLKTGKPMTLAREALSSLKVTMPLLNDEEMFTAQPMPVFTKLQSVDDQNGALIDQMNQSLGAVQQLFAGLMQMRQQTMDSLHVSPVALAQYRRWERVTTEIDHWFPLPKNAKLKKRVTIFMLLCLPASAKTLNVAKELDLSGKGLGSLEAAWQSEKLLNKLIDNHAPCFGPLAMLVELRQINAVKILNELYLKKNQKLFGLSNDLSEFDRRCTLLATPDQFYAVANLLANHDTPYQLSIDQRVLIAHKFALIADTPDAHALICEMYRKRLLGKELDEREVLLKMQRHNDLSPPNNYQKTLKLILHGALGEYDEAIELGEKLINADLPEKGVIYGFTALSLVRLNIGNLAAFNRDFFLKVYGYAKMAVVFGYHDATGLLEACEKARPVMMGEDAHESLARENDGEKAVAETITGKPSLNDNADDSKTKQLRTSDRKLEKQKRRIERAVALIKHENSLNVKASSPTSYPITFVNDSVKAQFEYVAEQQQKKIDELFLDIMNKPWGTEGSGHPEILKNFGKYGGLISRKIDGENRLVYDFVNGDIVIHACVGHYI